MNKISLAVHFVLLQGTICYVDCEQQMYFLMLYKLILTFESVDEILWCDH